MDKKILCIIPARGGSKGVIRKNLRSLGDKPLIQWTIDEAKKSKYIDKIIVSTEDDEIEEVCIRLDIEVVKRPMRLATDDSPTIDSIFYSLDILEDRSEYCPDFVLLLQCTSPFRTVIDIDNAIESLLNEDNNAKSLISVTKEEHPPWWLKTIDDEGILSDFISYDKKEYTRRQSFPSAYRLNGAVYICEVNELKKCESFETDKTLAYIMDSISSIDIDTEEDLKLAEYIIFNDFKQENDLTSLKNNMS